MKNNEWIIAIIKGKTGRGRFKTAFMKQIVEDIERTEGY